MARKIFGGATQRCATSAHLVGSVFAGCEHWQDMRKSGSTLAEILQAGQWKSSAFINYMNEAKLEQDVAFAVAIESEDEEWID